MALDVLIADPVSHFVVQEIEKHYKVHKLWKASDRESFINQIKDDVQFVVCVSGGKSKIDGDFMSKFSKLRGVINYGVGYDTVDAKWAATHNIMVTHTPDVLNEEVADISMGLLLAVIRQIPQADRFVREGKWPHETFPLSASLSGRTIGILGLGRIGRAIAKRAEAFNLKILYHNRRKVEGVPYAFYDNFKNMARDSDILMLVAPATADTYHIVNKEILEALGPEAVLINVGRGALVDENALIEALEVHKILAAGLDVYENEPHIPQRLIDLPNIVLLPHIGAGSAITQQAIGQLVIDNLFALAANKPPLTPVPEFLLRKIA